MPTTSPWNIGYPDGPSALTPLETVFATLAQNTNDALTLGLAASPRSAASDSARNTLFPSPVQGNRVWRTDKGYEEAYYALFNASTNPGGATPAGWYPSAGNLPRFYGTFGPANVPSATGVDIGGTGTNPAPYTEVEDVFGWHNPTTNPQRIVPTVAGLYRITAGINYAAHTASTRYANIQKNGADIPGLGLAWSPQYGSNGAGGAGLQYMNGTSDWFNVSVAQFSGTTLAVNGYVAVDYVGPTH